ncbi:MAG: putative toxin-antitoxin system toxin component, PIN family [Anaerolineae bacterium]|nr:putative toxin-antitoxin system toxin component, PIN family [Anaerolineae bacterium]
MRAVFDTNVFVRALIDPRSRCGRLLSEFSDDYVLVVFPAIVFELLSVITRPRVQAKFPHLVQLDYGTVLALFAQAEVVEPDAIPAIARDADDDKILACAQFAEADYLVTEDLDLLVLKTYQGTHICAPLDFIAVLEQRRSEISQ